MLMLRFLLCTALDQKDTEKALNKLQDYINRYPDSERMVEVNNLVEELLRKLERKSLKMPDSFTPSGILKQPSKQLTTL